MSSAVQLEDWLNEQGDDTQIVLSDLHPEVLILVDTTDFSLYRYVLDRDDDGFSKAKEELEKQMRAQTVGLGIGGDK
jgi:hypothetical protein